MNTIFIIALTWLIILDNHNQNHEIHGHKLYSQVYSKNPDKKEVNTRTEFFSCRRKSSTLVQGDSVTWWSTSSEASLYFYTELRVRTRHFWPSYFTSGKGKSNILSSSISLFSLILLWIILLHKSSNSLGLNPWKDLRITIVSTILFL